MRSRESGVIVQRLDVMSPTARRLIDALDSELSSRYPEPGANHFRLDADKVADGHGVFLVASRSGKPIGCGAVRRIEERTGAGVRQSEALALYKRAGFSNIAPFGEYVRSPLSICMAKEL